MNSTEFRPNTDASLTTRGGALRYANLMLSFAPITRLLTLAALVLLLTSCATPFVQPSVEVPARFAAGPESRDEPKVAWWESYGDPVLTNLIRRAARENRDIKVAAERLRAARAGVTISRSWMLPSVGVSAVGMGYNNEYGAPANQGAPDIKALAGGVDVSWEIDLSGRLRAGAEAAAANATTAEHGVQGAIFELLP